MEVGHERQQGCVDRRDVVREPVWQVDVGDRAALGAVSLRKRGQRTTEPVAGGDQAFAGDNRRGHPDPLIGASREAGIDDVDDTGLDRQPRQRVTTLMAVTAAGLGWTFRRAARDVTINGG